MLTFNIPNEDADPSDWKLAFDGFETTVVCMDEEYERVRITADDASLTIEIFDVAQPGSPRTLVTIDVALAAQTELHP